MFDGEGKRIEPDRYETISDASQHTAQSTRRGLVELEETPPNQVFDRGKAGRKLCAQLVSSSDNRGQGGGRSGELIHS
jgi:hypothetical protein